MSSWKILDTGVKSAEENMSIDQQLLEDLSDHSTPTLHLYDWSEDCATYGHFIRPESWLNMDSIKKRGIALARRPTGGGIVFHICDLAFSVLIPSHHPLFSLNTLDNYALINRTVVLVIQRFMNQSLEASLLPEEIVVSKNSPLQHFCMAKPTKYDVMLNGRKVGGAAQRRTRFGFLHQGTIAIALLPNDILKELLLPEGGVMEAMQNNSFSLLPAGWAPAELRDARRTISDLLIEELRDLR